MKAFFTQVFLFTAVCCTLQFSARSQATYTFKNPSLESGTSLTVGSVYRFSNVKPGVSAKITVMGFSGGVTLDAIDETWTGFDEAFQPFIHVAPNSNGYVEFKIDFCSGVSNTPSVQSWVPVTCIDVDGVDYGDGILYEKDQVEFFPGYYDFTMTGGNLNVTNYASWVIVKNTSGFSYGGIDTSAKDVMATVVNRNVSSFLIRIGAENTSPTKSEVRYRSVYFKPFNYGHPEPLAVNTVLGLSGLKKNNGVDLKVMLGGDNQFDKMIIERSANGISFSSIGETGIPAGAGKDFNVSYLDQQPLDISKSYYRVRLVKTSTGKEEISNTLMIKNDEKNTSPEIVTSLLQSSNPVLTIRSTEDMEANLQMVDLSGRIVMKTKIRLNAGSNNVSLQSFNSAKGYMAVVIETKNNQLIKRKVLVQ